MATFNQRSDALREYVSPVNVEAYGKVLEGLQKGYDKNVGELTKTEEKLKDIAQKSNLSEEAKDYFYKRMRERKDVLEKNMGNFAFANELDYGMKVLNSAVDDNVAIEMYNGSIFNKIGADYKKLAEGKNPELANSVNLEHSLQDINEWQNTKGHLGQKFQGNSTYVPYVDIIKIIDTEVKKQIPDAFAIATESGLQIKTSEGKFLSPSRVKEIVDMAKSANPQIAKQLEINGWNNYRNVGDNDFLSGVKGKLSEFIQNYEASAKAEEARTAGANLIEGTPIGQDAKRSKEYNENAAKYYKRILMGEDGKSGLMAMQNLTPAVRRQLETLLTEEDVKNHAANSFAYFAVNKSDIKLNEAASFQMSYDQKKEEIKIKDFDAQTARIKAIKDLNPNATYNDLVNGGVSPELASSAMLNPDNTTMEPIELKKTESYQESMTALNSQRDGVYSEIGDMAEKLTIMQTGDKSKGSQERRKWASKEYDAKETGINEYKEGLVAALKQNPDMKESESKMINQMLEKLEELGRYKDLEKEIAGMSKSAPFEPIRGRTDGKIDERRFTKTSGGTGMLGLEDAYIDNITGMKLSAGDALGASKPNALVNANDFVRIGLSKYMNIKTKAIVDESQAVLATSSSGKLNKNSGNYVAPININKLAEEKHGILLLASSAGEVEIKDINMIAKALKSVKDDELISYGLTDAKGLKEAIDKSITAKDGKEFPIQSLKIKSDGTATIVKLDGDEIQLRGYAEGSTIGQVINGFKQNVYNQQVNARKSAALIASARKPSGKTLTESINGKTAIVEINANSNDMWAKITYNGKEYDVVDANGETFFPIGVTLAEKTTLDAKVKRYIADMVVKIKMEEDASK